MIGLLFFYALLTGLSSSIMRAVVMFSTLLLGQWWNKRSSSYNILAFSAFLLLLYEPFWILSVGFQLSYLAVFGIFYVQPKIDRLFSPRWWVSKQIWSIITITIAAQIATTPICLFYFHQFPNYFLLSNLLALPTSTGVLYLVLATLAFGWIPYVGEFLGWSASYGIWFTNYLIFWIKKQPYQLTDGIWFEWWEVGLLYAAIVFGFMTWELYKTRYWFLAFLSLAIFTGSRSWRYIIQNKQKMLVVYNLNACNNLAMIDGHHAYFIADSTLQTGDKNYNFNIKNHLFKQGILKPLYLNTQVAEGAKRTHSILLNAQKNYLIAYFAGKVCLILKNKLSHADLKTLNGLKVAYCFLQNRAVYRLKDLQEVVQVGKLIVCPSNPKSYTQRIKLEAETLKIPAYIIAEQGAFVAKF